MDIERYRAQLIARRDALDDLRSMSAESRKAVELDQSKVGRLSRMDALQQQEMAKASEQQRLFALKRIHSALARCDDGEFGYCIECGEEISAPRLDIDPATPRCIDCADIR
ncbi:TraR/DksA family transcriptional regulator [Minwuia sp.]|uniref:TraR/DksA family transcriptional regulator n=1 Tax=Minwuia sp. TaxID=2493630 RepID=UPI003A953013